MSGKDIVVPVPGMGLVITPRGGNHIQTVKGYSGGIGQPVDDTKPTTIKSETDNDDTEYPWAKWGTNDDDPQKTLEINKNIGVILRGIEINADLHYGSGILFQKESIVNKLRVLEPVIPEWWQEFKRTHYFEEVLSQGVESTSAMDIAFCEVVMTNSTKTESDLLARKVASTQILDFCHTRFEKRDKKGVINHVYFHPDIGSKDNTIVAKDATKIPLYQPYWTKADLPPKFVIAVQNRSFNRKYYPLPNYTASHRNGWATVATQVPKLLSHVYENQMVIKYHVIVDIGYYKATYHCWENPPNCDTPEKVQTWQLQKMQEFSNTMNEHLTKAENAGKAIVTIRDEIEKIGVEIKPIQNFLDSAKELPNAAAANSEMLFVDGVDPTLVGAGVPGSTSGMAGSGSDKRVAANLKQATLTRSRITTLKILTIIGTVIYDMPYDVAPYYIDMDISQTLDENPKGKQEKVQA
jgi:hypothetical protein